MKNIKYIISILILLVIATTNAQEKVKGNKNVSKENRELVDFTKVEINNNLNVYITENDTNDLVVETDENLHSYIITKVEDGVLKIYTTSKIVRKNKLNIYLKLTNSINTIEINDDVKLISENIFGSDLLTIKANNDSDLKVNLAVNQFNLISRDNASANLTLKTKEADFNLSGRSKLKGNISIDSLTVSMINSSVLNAKGTINKATINANDNSLFKGRELLIEKAQVNGLLSSDIFINATDSLSLSLENSAEAYIYSNPEIIIEKFVDKASIHKKDDSKSLLDIVK